MQNVQNDSRYRAATLGALLARHYPAASPHSVGLVVFEMQRATRAAKKFAEDRCNFNLGDSEDPKSAYSRRDRAQDRAAFAITDRLAHPRLIEWEYASAEDTRIAEPAQIELGGDPRGACGRLIIPGQLGDGWGEGFAIY